jgi:hypothetical protein
MKAGWGAKEKRHIKINNNLMENVKKLRKRKFVACLLSGWWIGIFLRLQILQERRERQVWILGMTKESLRGISLHLFEHVDTKFMSCLENSEVNFETRCHKHLVFAFFLCYLYAAQHKPPSKVAFSSFLSLIDINLFMILCCAEIFENRKFV